MRMATACACAGLLISLALDAPAQPIADDRVEAMMVADGTAAIPIAEERLAVTIDGQHATTTLLQTYTGDDTRRREGQYRLRPGSGSHVTGFAYWNGEAKIVGEVFERGTARAVYDQVTRRNRDPGLLEQDGEGAFSFRVFPIEPHERKRVEVTWTKWLPRHAHAVQYRAPISRADADIAIAITGKVKNLRSTTHRWHVDRTAPDGSIHLRADGAANPHEISLEWDVDDPDWTPAAYVQPASGSDEGWFALALAAPTLPADAVAAKDVTIVIDRSGSMEGDKITHARAAARDMVRALDANDRVNVISFSDEVDPLFRTPQPVDAATRARAIQFIDKLHAAGGTDIALALTTAIAGQDANRDRPRVVVFLTDGQSDAEKAVAAAGADKGDIRLFTLGLGTDVNRPLLARLAALKRGQFMFIENPATIEADMARLAQHIAKPLLVDVSIDVEGPQPLRIYPRSLPDLYAEDELVVTGRLRGTGTGRFVVRGKLAGKQVTFAKSVDLAQAPARPWVGAMWAQARVDHLLEELALNPRAAELQTEVTDLALAYNFVTPYTAFLAIPESELGAMATTVAAARERKKKILADNPEIVAMRGLEHARDKKAVADRDDDDDAAKPGDGGHNYNEAIAVRQHGCAGCALAGDGSSAGILVVAIALLRRRRR
jgi:Ca-activated chloride channel family protein